MAYDNSFNTEEDNQQNAQQGQTANKGAGPQSLGPDGGVITTGTPGQGATGGSTSKSDTPTSSGSFTNLQSYLNANQDQNFGSQLASKVQNTVDQANQAQSNADTQFKGIVDQNTVNPNQDLINSAISDPTTFVSNQQNVDAFNQQKNANYSGPNSLSDESSLYNNAYQTTQNAQQAANATQNEGGRFALLNQYFNAPSYSQGEQNLDQFLVSADPTAGKAFQNVQQNANQAQQNWNNQLSADQGYASQAAQTTNSAATAARNALGIDASGNFTGVAGTNGDYTNGGAIGNLYNQINDAATADQSAYNTQNAAVQQALKSDNLSGLTPDELNQLGLSNFSGPLWDVSPANFLTINNNASSVNPQTVANAEQYAQMAALSQLAGTPDTLLPNSSLAGTAPTQGYTFNTPAFQSAINDSQNAFQQSLTKAPSISSINGSINSSTGYNISAAANVAGAVGVNLNANNLSDQKNQLQQAIAIYSKGAGPGYDASYASYALNQLQPALNQVNAQIQNLQTAAGGGGYFTL